MLWRYPAAGKGGNPEFRASARRAAFPAYRQRRSVHGLRWRLRPDRLANRRRSAHEHGLQSVCRCPAPPAQSPACGSCRAARRAYPSLPPRRALPASRAWCSFPRRRIRPPTFPDPASTGRWTARQPLPVMADDGSPPRRSARPPRPAR